MFIIESGALLLFVILMIVGYRKNNRNIMLAASLFLIVGFGATAMVDGVMDALA